MKRIGRNGKPMRALIAPNPKTTGGLICDEIEGKSPSELKCNLPNLDDYDFEKKVHKVKATNLRIHF